MRPSVAGLVLAGALLGSAVGAAEEPPALPEPDLDGLEAAVAEQLRALDAVVRERLADPSLETAQRAEAVGELGQHYHAYQLIEAAELCYRAARSENPGDFRWPYLLGYLQQTEGRLEEAARSYEAALAIRPSTPPALVRLGQVYAQRDLPEAAERNLRLALAADPTSAAAEAALGELLHARGRHAEAIELLEAALDKAPEANRLYYPLAMAHRALGDREAARELLARRGTVGVRPADPLIDALPGLATGARVHLLRGRTAFAAARYAEAAELFRQAKEAEPDAISARVNLASALAAAGQPEGAIAELLEVLELAPANTEALFNLASLYAARGDHERAATYFRETLLYDGDDHEARGGLARALRRLGRDAEAETHYRSVVAADPSDAEAHLGLAGLLVDRGELAAALAALEAAHAQLPASGRIAHALARMLAAAPDPGLRDGERALDLARRVYEARPEVEHAVTLAESLAELGRCVEAAEVQRAVVEAWAEAGAEDRVERARERLRRYEGDAPCRPPILQSR